MQKLKDCPVCGSHVLSSFITTKAQMHSTCEQFNFDKCGECQLVFLNPRVAPDQLKAYYTEHYLPYRGAKAWGKFEAIVQKSLEQLDQKRVNRVKEWHQLDANALILDVGCGQPSFLKACHEQLDCQTLGIDFSDEGWVNQEHNYNALTLRMSEIRDLPLDLQPDVITMWHYLEHDYFPSENLTHLRSISKPSTSLIIEIPNFDSSSQKEFGKDWAGWHTPRHISLFSPTNIELLLNKSGWNVKKSLTYGTMDPYLLYWMSKMEKKGIAWDKTMEDEFFGFMLGMIRFLPLKLMQKKKSLGIMTLIATPA